MMSMKDVVQSVNRGRYVEGEKSATAGHFFGRLRFHGPV